MMYFPQVRLASQQALCLVRCSFWPVFFYTFAGLPLSKGLKSTKVSNYGKFV